MTGFFNCTIQWIVVLTEGYGGFCSALNKSEEGFYTLMNELSDVWEKLERLPEDELLHEIDCGAVAFLRGRIENHYRLPGSPQTYSMNFAHACNKNVRRIFSAWRTKAKKLGKDERKMLSSMLDDVQYLYLRKVLYFKQLFKDAAPQPSETASKYDWNKQVIRVPFKPQKTPDYATVYDRLKNECAIDAYDATMNRKGLTEERFIHFAQRAAFGDMFQWAKEHGRAMKLKGWVFILSQAFDREWRVEACEEMGISFNYLSNNGSTKSKIKANFAKD